METEKKVIRIDRRKCNGCGFCVEACAKGHLRICFSKAEQVKGVQCDGEGKCIEVCSEHAITLVPAS